MHIEDAVIVLTGSSSGIGLALSLALLAKGAVVYGISRRKTPIQDPRFLSIEADLGIPEELSAAFSRIRRGMIVNIASIADCIACSIELPDTVLLDQIILRPL
ncbi:NAD-dependent epimerase/dehydratase family protein [Chlorobium phaeovibrioides]|uniref:NAD-dependent epimerase/dehydratase family protein n=1 Tax=Chlorobium phaeovibrioides TaxID=1094 RepID=UPI001230A240|nr:NAD-dependent epimerase/dehydratase family protein [Chlorobium phaeovibrioides]QEQ56371.1 hypothetical protein FNV82_00860 [Chlorobium phaeovibrioides]